MRSTSPIDKDVGRFIYFVIGVVNDYTTPENPHFRQFYHFLLALFFVTCRFLSSIVDQIGNLVIFSKSKIEWTTIFLGLHVGILDYMNTSLLLTNSCINESLVHIFMPHPINIVLELQYLYPSSLFSTKLRTLFVGVASALIVLIPALPMTTVFRKRRPRRFTRPQLNPSTASLEATSPPPPPRTLRETEPGSKEEKPNSDESATSNSDPTPSSGHPHRESKAPRPTDEGEEEDEEERVDGSRLEDPLKFLPQQDDSSGLATIKVDPSPLEETPASSRLSVDLPSALSVRGSPDSGYRSPVVAGTKHEAGAPSSGIPVQHKIEKLSPGYPELYNNTSVWEDRGTTHLSIGHKYTRILKSYNDSEQTYDHLCNRQSGEEEMLQDEAKKRKETKTKKKSRFLPWWTIFIGYGLIFLSIAASATFTLFYSLTWGGRISLEWMASIFFSTSASTFLIEPLQVKCTLLI